MLGALTILLFFQLIGEMLVRGLGLPVPGPVLGMMLLFLTLRVRGSVPRALGETSQTLLLHLGLLFVPAGVGVMVHYDLIRTAWLPLLVVIVLTTLITLVATAWTMQWLLRLTTTSAARNQ
jgi:holin-like protein